MHLGRVQVINFRNFLHLDVVLDANVVIVGENRVGKSNLIFALRLVLDTALSDSARQLKMSDICDLCDLASGPEVRVHLDFLDFDKEVNVTALLTDYRLAADHNIARLSYVFRPKAGLSAPPASDADYEFKIYGGDDESRSVRSEVRRRIALDVMHALRDAESELAMWRTSPLRPLLDDAIGTVSKQDLDSVGADVTVATERLTSLDPISALEASLRSQMLEVSGSANDLNAKLGFAAADPLRLFRSIGLYIDGGKRSINEASLGSANIALLSLKLAEFEWRRQRNERNHTIMCVEEPEAHLHPQLQRHVFQKLLDSGVDAARHLVLTTHSPNVASVAPIRSLVVLQSTPADGTIARSLARLKLTDDEREDLERYLDVNRAEILFSRGVIFVEGAAELALVPAFAKRLNVSIDEIGISICSVGGVHFGAYVRLACALGLKFSVITDWDPVAGKQPLARKRVTDLVVGIRDSRGDEPLAVKEIEAFTDPEFIDWAKSYNIYTNTSTFEVELANDAALIPPLLDVLDEEGFGPTRQARIKSWRDGSAPVDGEQLLSMVADIGKGRLAARLVPRIAGFTVPSYIGEAITRVCS